MPQPLRRAHRLTHYGHLSSKWEGNITKPIHKFKDNYVLSLSFIHFLWRSSIMHHYALFEKGKKVMKWLILSDEFNKCI